jgi:glycosyltransferase involved in cell wall biosynthesis
MERAAHGGLAGRVHFPGYVRDGDLPALYSLASVFAFPSWYEGFGLPVLEAMACGTPVVAADNSSLPEVVGEAGLLVDAGSADQLAGALLRLLTDPELATALAVTGRARAGKFTWNRAARELVALYRRFAAAG